MKRFSLIASSVALASVVSADTVSAGYFSSVSGAGAGVPTWYAQTIYGVDAAAYGLNSTVIGTNATSNPDQYSLDNNIQAGGTAIGAYSKTIGAYTTAVGGASQAGMAGNGETSFASAFGVQSFAGGMGSTAIGGLAAVSNQWGIPINYATAIGYGSQVQNDGILGTAIGSYSQVNGANGVALGAYSFGYWGLTNNVALGYQATNSFGNNSVALGANSNTVSSNEVSVGSANGFWTFQGVYVDPFYRRITNVADPVNNHDAVNKQYADAILTSAKTYTDTAVSSSGSSGGAVDLSPAYNYTNAVAGVVAAYADMTAANAAAQAESNANGYTDTQTAQAIKTANSYTDVKAAETLISANSYTDTKIASSTKAAVAQANGYTDDIAAGLKKEINKSTALAAALAASPTIEAGKQSGLSLSSGHYHGSSAMAVAYARRLDSSTTLTLAASGTSGDIASRASVSFSW